MESIWEKAKTIGDRLEALKGEAKGGVRMTSERTLWGVPLVDVAVGRWGEGDEPGRARGVIAVGDEAEGVLAVGGRARGIFALGGQATGAFAVGGASAGYLAVGGAAKGRKTVSVDKLKR